MLHHVMVRGLERRYRACLVEDDTYALATLRYLDRNPVRPGIVDDPAAYPWWSCKRCPIPLGRIKH